MPVNNDLVLLEQVLQQRQQERAAPVSDARAFEIFACEQALRALDVAVDEVEAGVVGDGGDAAIDGVFVFLGGELLSEDSDIFQDGFTPSRVPTRSKLELWLVQAKRETSFTETAVDLVADSTRRLLDLGVEESDLRQLYNDEVVRRTGYFRQALRALATRHPKVEVRFVYATKGNTRDVNAKVQIKGNELARQFEGVMTGCVGHAEFVGAAELWARSNQFPSYTMTLKYQEDAASEDSHVALVKLRDYMDFLTDESEDLRRHIFDWNVRDYQGDVEVNKEIRASIADPEAPEFWWLNNGVTIVCSRATSMNRTYSLDNVQVVNGLQTSHTMFEALRELPSTHPAFDRSVLVRILVTGDDETTRDRVIRATNRQTTVPVASLRATDQIQRDIEAYFAVHAWYYDRRKNYYRNIGKSAERIVSIPLLAQAIMAMGLSRPDNSRARPSSLLKRNEDYDRIFDRKLPLGIYLWLAQTQKIVDTFLLSDAVQVSPTERTNFRFHIAMVAAARLVGARVHHPSQLGEVVERGAWPSSDDLHSAYRIVAHGYLELVLNGSGLGDKVVKGPDFVEYLHKRALDAPPAMRRE